MTTVEIMAVIVMGFLAVIVVVAVILHIYDSAGL